MRLQPTNFGLIKNRTTYLSSVGFSEIRLAALGRDLPRAAGSYRPKADFLYPEAYARLRACHAGSSASDEPAERCFNHVAAVILAERCQRRGVRLVEGLFAGILHRSHSDTGRA